VGDGAGPGSGAVGRALGGEAEGLQLAAHRIRELQDEGRPAGDAHLEPRVLAARDLDDLERLADGARRDEAEGLERLYLAEQERPGDARIRHFESFQPLEAPFTIAKGPTGQR